MHCHRGRETDDDVSDGRSLGFLDFPPRPVDLLQDPSRVLEKALAGLRRRRAATVAQEQALAQFHLEGTHVPAERGLRDAEDARGAAEAAEVDHVDEVGQLFQVHRCLVPIRGAAAGTHAGLT